MENVIELYAHKRHLEEKLQDQYELLEQQAEKLKQANTSIIDMLSTVVEFRNGESGFHIRRIRYITKLLMEALGARYEDYRFSDEQIQMITDASALHDIGKRIIPDMQDADDFPFQFQGQEFFCQRMQDMHLLRGRNQTDQYLTCGVPAP